MKVRMTVTVDVDPDKLGEHYRLERYCVRENVPPIVGAILERALRNADSAAEVSVR